ncbi:hypothetical protein Rsub_04582 [Raphidocelis subcapitata]|uniref:DAPG hydrolase PhiG domain-containing protein n=1 Tax=Raphidocelis subcapitata TaxID=307507 RepID=A0A2V0NXW9_9CHLO|nr:hypothetical protein Rsub_04582 [Raphidocelis subcapitata]|eukprot:GBF92478.1 hypothetical protein Rsub_04582 [Raphidocelis subcapitata]
MRRPALLLALAGLALLAAMAAADAGDSDLSSLLASEPDDDLRGAAREVARRERRADREARRADRAEAKQQAREAKATKCKKGSWGIIIQKPIQNKVLPAERPAPWPLCGLGKCNLSVAIDMHVQPQDGIRIEVIHKPLTGITAEMMEWWFSGNIEGTMVDPRDNKTYTRYLIWHPTDHIHEITKKPSKTPGSVIGAVREITEFIGAQRATPYTSADRNCEWNAEHYANDELEVAALDRTGLSLQLKIGYKNKPMRMRHSWSDSPDGTGLLLNSTLNVGFTGDRPIVARINRRYCRRAFGGDNQEKSAELWANHCLEEFANLKNFLPDLFKAEAGKP